ncbi:MAG TPA: DUF6098 family protein [Actinophytocola sp.]|jgi:hypothetical protein|uniref:DUF6098 family protein n=1 Tax=Actinophytocola sp. TaxID=1872138 RepID=UPI002F959AFE
MARSTDDALGLPTLARLAELSALADGDIPVYLRYSPGPVSDAAHPSKDHESGLVMPGVSANPLRPPGWWSLPGADWVARAVCQYLRELDEGARPWVLTGEVVDFGPDNEPLLTGVRPIAWLSRSLVREAHQRYHERLAAGRATH